MDGEFASERNLSRQPCRNFFLTHHNLHRLVVSHFALIPELLLGYVGGAGQLVGVFWSPHKESGFSHWRKSRYHQSSQRLKPDLHAPLMQAGNGLLHPTHSASAGVRSRATDDAVNEANA